MEASINKAPAAAGAPASSGGRGLRFAKFAVALCLLPLCVGMTRGAARLLIAGWHSSGQVKHFAPELVEWFCGGAAVFALFAAMLWRPVIVYVFGHELMHALATWLCLGRVSNLRASASGGSVTSSKTNMLIRLAPYCVPLYAVLAAGVYLALDHWWRPLHAQLPWAMAALGFCYAFHLGFTIWSMRRDQPDLQPDGWCFSLVVIFLANLAVFTLLAGFVLTGKSAYAWPALKNASVHGWQYSVELYETIATNARHYVIHPASEADLKP